MITTSGNKKIDNAIIIGVIILIAYFVYKAIKTFSNPIGSAQELLDITPDTELPNPANLPVNPANLTHTIEQFKIWAVELYESIWTFIADKQTIREIMYQINSDDDLKQIIKSYGTQTSLFGLVGGEGGLLTHLRDVMSEEDIAGFNSHYEGFNMRLRI
jgi:hypothetical protein